MLVNDFDVGSTDFAFVVNMLGFNDAKYFTMDDIYFPLRQQDVRQMWLLLVLW